AGDADDALATLDAATAKWPDRSDLHGARAAILLDRGRVGGAVAAARAARRTAPHDPKTARLAAECLLAAGRPAEAAQELEECADAPDAPADLGVFAARVDRFAGVPPTRDEARLRRVVDAPASARGADPLARVEAMAELGDARGALAALEGAPASTRR